MDAGAMEAVCAAEADEKAPPTARPRVLLITASFFPEVIGGAERQALILAEAMGRAGGHVTILSPAVEAQSPAQEAKPFGAVRRIKVRAYPNLGGRNLMSTLSWTRQALAFASAAAPAFDVVYVFHARLHALAGVFAAEKLGAPLLIKLGGQGEGSDFNALLAKKLGYGRWALARVLGRTDLFVANSAAIVDDLREAGVDARRIAAFPNGVRLPEPAAIAEGEARRTGARLIYAGRLSPDKRIEVTIEALSKVRARGVGAELTLLGRGPDEGRLKEAAARFGVAEAVRFAGAKDDVYPAMLSHDVFVSASLREGQSNALLEALACGCIPVAAAASGVVDTIREGETGFVCEDPSASGLSDGIMRVLAQRPEARAAMAHGAREDAARRFGIDAIARRTFEAFEHAGRVRSERRHGR
jgi:glycosyltransferase involved in cell wall biosynthesis